MNTEFESDLDLLGETLPSSAPSHTATETGSAEPYRMRCPNCKKLYSVEAHLLGSDDLTKFECVDCQTAFFAMRPELNGARFLETRELETQFAPLIAPMTSSLPMVDGFVEGSFAGSLSRGQSFVEGLASDIDGGLTRDPASERVARSSVLQVPTSSRECPNCHTLNALSNTECTKCEIVFAQFRPGVEAVVADDVALSENAELVMMWQDIQDGYQDLARHEAFVARCAGERRLTFAAHKYAQILIAAPEEPIARLMRARVQGMASYGFDARDNGLGWTTWSFPLPSFNSFIIFLGTILVMVGLGLPNMRQTAGLGVAMIALAIGLRIFLRRPRT